MEFTVKTKFRAKARDIFNAWLNSDSHSEMTGGGAKVSNKEGGSFIAWDGYITGTNLILEPYKRIVQSWRTMEFSGEDEDSQIEIVLEERGEETELTLIHSGLTEHGKIYIEGWDENYFQPMKEYFNRKIY